MDDRGNNNFGEVVILNKPSKVRSVLLMEDLSDWQNKNMGTMLDKDEIIMCLKNIAIMHARFWGDRKKDISNFLG